MNKDKRYETIGRAICTISYWFYALKFILTVTIAAGIILLIFDFPLWLAPAFGVAVFLIYRFIRRIIFKILYKLSRM